MGALKRPTRRTLWPYVFSTDAWSMAHGALLATVAISHRPTPRRLRCGGSSRRRNRSFPENGVRNATCGLAFPKSFYRSEDIPSTARSSLELDRLALDGHFGSRRFVQLKMQAPKSRLARHSSHQRRVCDISCCAAELHISN